MTKFRFILHVSLLLLFNACSEQQCGPECIKTGAKPGTAMVAENKDSIISCKLTSEELQKRRKTVLASLKGKTLEKKELPDGFAFKFPGDDKMVDELNEFIKTERILLRIFSLWSFCEWRWVRSLAKSYRTEGHKRDDRQ